MLPPCFKIFLAFFYVFLYIYIYIQNKDALFIHTVLYMLFCNPLSFNSLFFRSDKYSSTTGAY